MAYEYSSLGYAVWWNRRINRMTQAELAERAGCSIRTIYSIEHNKYIELPREMVSRLATALNVDVVTINPWFHSEAGISVDKLLNGNPISGVDIDMLFNSPISLELWEEVLNCPDMDESPAIAI